MAQKTPNEATAWSLVDELLGLTPDQLALRLAELRDDRRREVEEILQLQKSNPLPEFEAPVFQVRLAAQADQIGPYLLQEELAQGGTSSVFRALRADNLHTIPLAVKVVHFASLREKEQLFRQEVRILARLSHPGIVRLLDGGVSSTGLFYLVMEFVEGDPLQIYSRQRTLTLRRRIELTADICAAVGYAHSMGIVHRDIKPSNILVSRNGQPKLLDFGIARFKEDTGEAAARTVVTRLTADYASPEQLRGERPLTEAGDVYSLGVILHELLLGNRPPAPSHDPDAEPPVLRIRGVDPDLEAILQKALAFRKGERYSDAREFELDLRAWLAGTAVGARHLGRLGRAWRWARRQQKRAALASAALLAGVVLAGVWWQQDHKKDLAWVQARQLQQIDRAPTVEYLEKLYGDQLVIFDRAERLNGPRVKLVRGKLALHCRVAEMMGYPGTASFGNIQRAAQIYRTAVDTIDRTLAAGATGRDLWPFFVTARIGLGATLLEIGDTDGSEQALLRAMEALNMLEAAGLSDLDLQFKKPDIILQLSRVNVRRGQHTQALRQRQQAVALVRSQYPDANQTSWLAGVLAPLAWSQNATGDLPGALATYREAEALMREQRKSPVRNEAVLDWLPRNLYEQGRILNALGRHREAREALEESVARLDALVELTPASAERRRWLALAEAHLASLRARMGQRGPRTQRLAESSRAHLGEVLAQAPGNVYVAEELREVERLLASARVR